MQQLASFLSGTWQSGRGRARTITHAISGETLFEVTSEGLDMAAVTPLNTAGKRFAQ